MEKSMAWHERVRYLFENPGYVGFEVLRRLIPFAVTPKTFSTHPLYRSDSDNGYYLSAVNKALSSQRHFDTFLSSYRYRKILGHVSRKQGSDYLEILRNRDVAFLKQAFDLIFSKDVIGGATKYHYPDFESPVSPTTIRYVKVASDLKLLFGSNLNLTCEIGAGYGGQALVNDQLLEVKKAILIDLPVVNQLISRYLNSFVLTGSFEAKTINNLSELRSDVVISNYAFSELPYDLQLQYLQKIISRSPKGYLTMNSGLTASDAKSRMTCDAILEAIPSATLYAEEPKTHPGNYLIVWGEDKNTAQQWFKPLKQL